MPQLRFTSRDGERSAFRTTARIAWNASHLFVAIVNHEPEMDKLTALADKSAPARTEIWNDDIVDIIVCPDAENRQQ